LAGSLTIRGASIVRSAGVLVGDVVVVDGIIREVAPSARSVAGEVVDGRGLVLMPGVIDPQVHFRDPGLTHKEDLATGSRAAAAGGVTAFLEMPNTKPNTSTLEALDAKLAIGAEKCVVHYGFFIGATGHNDDVLDAADKACGIKIFMGASTGDLLVTDPDVLDRIFRTANKLIAVHAEDERRLIERKASLPADHPRDHPVLRDATAALMATKQAVGLSLKYGTRLHVLHVSSEEEADFLTTVPRDRITAEVCPHHFVLDYEDYERLGTRAQCNPPVRGGRHAVVEAPRRRHVRLHRDRPRTAHPRREGQAVPGVTVRNAGRRVAAPVDGRSCRARHVHLAGPRALDVRGPRPLLRNRRQGQDRARLRRRPRPGRSTSDAHHPRRRGVDQVRLEPVRRLDDHRLARHDRDRRPARVPRRRNRRRRARPRPDLPTLR
jgi:hypothetical protein